VDCTRDPVYICEEGRLPQISVFNHTELLSTFQENDETISQYLDRTILVASPAAPPRVCCPTLKIDNADACTGTYNKTSQVNNGRVLYKQVFS